MGGCFSDDHSVVTPREEPETKTITGNRNTENISAGSKVKSPGSAAKRKKKIKQPSQKLETQTTIGKETSKEIVDYYTSKL